MLFASVKYQFHLIFSIAIPTHGLIVIIYRGPSHDKLACYETAEQLWSDQEAPVGLRLRDGFAGTFSKNFTFIVILNLLNPYCHDRFWTFGHLSVLRWLCYLLTV